MEIDQGDLASYGEVCTLLRNAERRERALKRRIARAIETIEDQAAAYGGAAMNPIGKENTRTNRVKLTFLSCGMNEAASILRSPAKERKLREHLRRARS